MAENGLNSIVKKFPNPQAAAVALKVFWIKTALSAINKHGRFTVALSGGNSPIILFDILAKEVPKNIWDRTHIFQVDERLVAVDHQDSNYGMLKKELLNKLPTKEVKIYPFKTFLGNPELVAEDYSSQLKEFFASQDYSRINTSLPVFDLILLGLGEDGHIASLFPEMPNHEQVSQLVISSSLERIKHSRVSLTLPVINAANNVCFLVIGKNKARILREILYSHNSKLPAGQVLPKSKVIFYLDDAAATMLS